METKLCRICGKLGQNEVNVFQTEGLKNKIETCLPIIVSPHSLLPDTICVECSEHVSSYYNFIKNCLQHILVLEAHLDIKESCLKTKRKHDKSTQTEPNRTNQSQQTDDYLDVFLKDNQLFDNFEQFNQPKQKLVDYDLSESETDSIINDNKKLLTRKYFDDDENELINEIIEKRRGIKRKLSHDDDIIMKSCTKIFKLTSSNNRRKNTKPKKIDLVEEQKLSLPPQICLLCEQQLEGPSALANHVYEIHGIDMTQVLLSNNNDKKKKLPNLVKISDLKKPNSESTSAIYCEDNQVLEGYYGSAQAPIEQLSEDTYSYRQQLEPSEVCYNQTQQLLEDNNVQLDSYRHQPLIDAYSNTQSRRQQQLESSESRSSRAQSRQVKQQPLEDASTQSRRRQQPPEGPPTLLPSFVCPLCPAVFTIRHDLFNHLRLKHSEQAALLCGICLHQTTTQIQLKTHLDLCRQQHTITTRYYCEICYYGDDNARLLENHVPVHQFLLDSCTKQLIIFDPANYIKLNETYEGSQQQQQQQTKSLYTCDDCGLDIFEQFKEFSTHRRNQHSIFHCDLCNKFYGRNSHLWKHVNRLHKGHPSITCQLCFKTSASKYHLAQHFNKIHTTKSIKQQKLVDLVDESNDFMSQKFQAFDFQSVKQSFMRQEIIEQDRKKLSSGAAGLSGETEKNVINHQRTVSIGDSSTRSSPEMVEELKKPPKEIDSSSDLYTNIITNYTPPTNEGEFKCPKCSKGFHKKNLLKKHKKNCRPRLQKDLLTRCKSCSRIFKDRQSLTKHLINYHSEYICEICTETVQSKCEIVSHIRFSHQNCHLICTLCSNILRTKYDLIQHRNDHSNSYICQFCGDSLPSKIKLKMHILSLHRKILSLSCGLCLKLFETQYILRDHVRLVHYEQLKPLTSCTVCGKNYGSKWKTYDHLNKSHGRIFKACKFCLNVFDNEIQLNKHYQSVHNTSNVVVSGQSKITNQQQQQQNQALLSNHLEGEGESELESEQSEEELNRNVMTSLPNNMAASKISLLEKRLLGNKKLFHNNNNNNKLMNAKKKFEDSPKLQQPQQQVLATTTTTSSSKRTVYVNSNDPSCCEICYKTWPAKKHLWQHYIRCHKQVAATVCGICLKTNLDYKCLQKHLSDNHPTLLFGQGFGSNFICRICGRYHNASSKLKLHMAIHENFNWDLLDNNDNDKKNVEGCSNPVVVGPPIEVSVSTTTTTTTTDMLLIDEKTKNPSPSLNNASSNVVLDEAESKINRRLTNDLQNGLIKSDVNDDLINYESLIEQVECSTENDDDDDDDDGEEEEEEDSDDDKDKKSTNSSSDTDDDSDDVETDNDDTNSLENQMLRNMLREKQLSNEVSQTTLIKYDDDNDDTTSNDTTTNFSDIIIKSDDDDDELEDNEDDNNIEGINSETIKTESIVADRDVIEGTLTNDVIIEGDNDEEEEEEVNNEASTDDEEDSSHISINSSSQHTKSNSSSTNLDIINNTSEQLDSAVQSIKPDCSDDDDYYYDDDDDDIDCDDMIIDDVDMFSEQQQSTINNDNEIESAVGSIL